MLSKIKAAGIRKSLIVVLTIVFLLFQSYLIFIKSLHPLLQVPIHWALILMITFLYKPVYIRPEGAKKSWKDALAALDIIIFAVMAALIYYFISQSPRFLTRIPYIDQVYLIDKIAMVVSILVILEAGRRCLGWSLVVFVSLFVAYFWTGPYLRGIFFHSGTNMARFTDLMTLGVEGIFRDSGFELRQLLSVILLSRHDVRACAGGQV
jgi:TRAP-type uncharacterized transport system fused permease subunit